MSRSDWISISITLICVALTYYLGLPKVALSCGIIGVLVLIALFINRQQEEPKSSVSASVEQNANPVVTQNANPVVNVNINNSSSAPVAAPVEEPQNVSKAADPKSNINLVDAKWIGTHWERGNEILHESPEGLHDVFAAVVCFRNDPILGMRLEEPSVCAHIIYRDAEGREICDVSKGVWIGEYGETVTFNAGQKHCLVVLMQSKQNTLLRVWKESYYDEHSWMSGGPSYRVRQESMNRTIGSSEINLIAHNTCVKQITIKTSAREGELPKLVVS